MARKAPKGRHSKTETVSIRFDPRVRYGLELLARKQHRTLSQVVEWAVSNAMDNVEVTETMNVRDAVNLSWDPQQADRVMKLANTNENLLTYEEQVVWKFVRETPLFWIHEETHTRVKGRTYEVPRIRLDFQLVRACWDLLNEVPEGVTPDLKKIAAVKKKLPPSDPLNDIPFSPLTKDGKPDPRSALFSAVNKLQKKG